MAIFVAGEGDTLNQGRDDYSPGELVKIDRAIRHMLAVETRERIYAERGVQMTGSDNFDVIVQNDPSTSRARAYMAPINSEGIHEELSQSLLLKAALALEGQ